MNRHLGRDEKLGEPVESPLEVVRSHVEEIHRVLRVRVGVARPSVGAEIGGVAVVAVAKRDPDGLKGLGQSFSVVQWVR